MSLRASGVKPGLRTASAISAAVLTAGLLTFATGTAGAEPACVENAAALSAVFDAAAGLSTPVDVTLCDNITLSPGVTLDAGATVVLNLGGHDLTIEGAEGADGGGDGTAGLTVDGNLVVANGNLNLLGGNGGSGGIGTTGGTGGGNGTTGTAGGIGGPGVFVTGVLAVTAKLTTVGGSGGDGGRGGNGGNGSDAQVIVGVSGTAGTKGGTGGVGGQGGNGGYGLSVDATGTLIVRNDATSVALDGHAGRAGYVGSSGAPGLPAEDLVTGNFYAGGLGGNPGSGGSRGLGSNPIDDTAVTSGLVLEAPDGRAPNSVIVHTAPTTTVVDILSGSVAAMSGVWPARTGFTLDKWVTVAGAEITGADLAAGQVIIAVWKAPTPGPPPPPASTDTGDELPAAPVATPSRITGRDQYETANAIAKQGAWSGKAVVLASGVPAKDGMDALAANYLAGQVGAPLLLAGANGLSRGTIGAIMSILTGSNAVIYVMGGADSISQETIDTLLAQFPATNRPSVVRLGGLDRYATSALAAAAGRAAGTVGSFALRAGAPVLKTAILASGVVNADALTAGPIAYACNLPLLWTGPNALPAQVASTIQSLGIQQIIVLGGTDRVSAKVVGSLSSLDVSDVKRISGNDRYITSTLLNTFARASQANQGLGMNGSRVYLANGVTGFSVALAAGPLAGQQSDSLLTVPGSTLPGSTAAFISGQTGVTGVTGLGSDGTVARSVLTAAANSIK